MSHVIKNAVTEKIKELSYELLIRVEKISFVYVTRRINFIIYEP